MEQDNSIFGSLPEGIPADFGGNGSVMYGIRWDHRTRCYDFNDAPAQLPERQPRDLDELSDRLAACAPQWVPELYPRGRISKDRKELRLANIEGDGPRHDGSCVITLKGDRAGSWHDHSTGKGGGPLSTLQMATGLGGGELFDRAEKLVGSTPKPNGKATVHDKKNNWQHEVAYIKQGCIPIAGTLGETYLEARGLDLPNCPDLLFHELLTDYDAKRGRPGVVAVIRDPATGAETGGIHRTFLADDGFSKAPIDKPKKMLGPSTGVIMLAPMSEDGRLGIAEGVENALAATRIFGVPTWSGVSAGGVGRFGEGGFPAGLTKLDIFADRGDAGETAANDLYHRAVAAGIEVAVYLPLGATKPDGKLSDFNDDLLQGCRAGDYAAFRPANSPPENPDIPDNAALQRSAIQLIDFENMEPRIKDRSIIHHILNEGEISGLVGASSTGKTFLALDMGLHVAAGWDWFGHTTRQNGVIYVAAEAGPGIVNRVAAFKKHYEMPPKAKLPFAVVVSPVDLRQPSGHTNDLIAAIHAKERERGFRVGLVIIDTLNRAMAGGDENRSDDMGGFIRNVDRLRDATGAHILIVHHLGKNPKNGARGHSSFHAALDTEILVERDNKMGISTAAATKQRELPLGCQINFKLVSIELGRDQHDRPVTSCVVEPTDEIAADSKKRPRLAAAQKRALNLLVDAVARHGQIPPANDHIPTNVQCVRESYWRECCYAGQISESDKQDTKQKAFKRAAKDLVADGHVGKWEDWVWPVQ